MNYLSIYQSLMRSAKGRKLDGYLEVHHILPRCMGGLDDSENLVSLTPREHFVAHQLLVRIHPKVRGLWFAVFSMSKRGDLKNSRSYQWLREGFCRAQSEALKGKARDPNHLAAMHAASRGVPKSEEHRRKLSESLRGRRPSEQAIARLRTMGFGRVVSEESKIKMAKSHAHLSDEQVRLMRFEYEAGGVMDRISAKYGISKSAGSRIMKRKAYAWVK